MLFDNSPAMMTSVPWPYRYPASHETVSDIIRRRSTNGVDVRDVAFGDLELSGITRVLDLGCGFGFNAEPLAKRVAPQAQFVGVDAWRANEAPYVQRVTAAGRKAEFVWMEVGSKLPYADRSFDLVVCSYSLYFFVEALGEIARVLNSDGIFVTITHSESSVAGHLPAAGLNDAADRMLSLTRRFSAENGSEHLRKCFGKVIRIDYPNTLVFKPEHTEELLLFLKFKLPHLVPGAKPGDELPEALLRFVREQFATSGELVLEKNDAIFQCWGPLCQ